MGSMVDGRYYREGENAPTDRQGEWHREPSAIRNWITSDGGPGPTGEGGFAADPERYHLYVSWNCPWAHRTLLARHFKQLEELITISIAKPRRTEEGWVFDHHGEFSDSLLGIDALHEVYAEGADSYTGRVTVPVLWDKKTGTIVSNESADIVRMFDTAFEEMAPKTQRLYPKEAAKKIDQWNELIYRTVNNGVYRAGFAGTQSAYEKAAREVFETLDAIDRHLASAEFLVGDRFSEADLRLFPTLARFDVAYHYAFKCNLKKISDYPHLWPYARFIYQMPGISRLVKFDLYKQGYFSPSEKRNPLGIVPIGPETHWDAPHGR